MISQVTGTLLSKELDSVEILTSSGVGYELSIPLSAFEALPNAGERVTLHTHLVVREDGWQLFGFAQPFDRSVFRKVLDAKGVGPALALGMLSALSAERLVRAIREKDVTTLQSVPRVGRKKAEQLVLDLADKLDGLAVSGAAGTVRSEGAAAEDAVRALVSLGYSPVEADRAVRAALDSGGRTQSATDLIRNALGKIGARS
jgi:holliday junction DNA helicase RuvA